MNLRLATTTWPWLIATTTSSAASAAGVRGKDKQQRRVLQEGKPARYLIQEIDNDNEFWTRDNVELSNNLIYKVEGFMPPWWERSGQDIFLPPATIIDYETATITLPYPFEKDDDEYYFDDDDSTLTEDQERNLSELRRQLAVVTGEKTVLAVKVVLSDAAYEFDDSYLECKVFGTSNGVDCDDTYHLANAYSDCSFGKLQLKKASDRTNLYGSHVSDISNGVVTVTFPHISTSDGDDFVRNEVTRALNQAFGVGSASGLADHLMYCLPPMGGECHEIQCIISFVHIKLTPFQILLSRFRIRFRQSLDVSLL